MRDILSNLQEGYKIVPFNIVHYFLVNMNDIQLPEIEDKIKKFKK